MKLNKKALKAVCEFWAWVSLLILLAGGLCLIFSKLPFLILVVPFLLVSFFVYMEEDRD